MKNVLVIGAGRRALGAILPALGCLEDRFRVAGVLARKTREIRCGGRRWTTIDSLDRVDLAAVDLIAVAATIGQVPRLLADLARRPVGQAALLLDTPVLPPTGLGASRFFPAFRRVVVAEDNLALPPFLLARRLIDGGAIGRLRRIFFFHNGYKHHALASFKFLAGGAAIRRIASRRFGGKMRMKEIELDGPVSAVMYEPRDYATGKFLLVGATGTIADYEHAIRPVHRIGYQVDGPVYRGLTLDGEPVPPSGLDHAYLAHIGPDVHDASPMNTMKLRGLMDLLVAALEDSSPHHYDPAEGVCDYLAAQLVDKIGYLPAPARLRHLMPAARRLHL